MNQTVDDLHARVAGEPSPWRMLLSTVRVALRVEVLLLAALGAVASAAGWRIVDEIFYPPKYQAASDSAAPLVEALGQWPGGRGARPVLKSVPRADGLPLLAEVQPANPIGLVRYLWAASPVRHVWTRISDPVAQFWQDGLKFRGGAALILGGAFTLLVWALLGGAISRIAAVRLARDERVGMGDAVKFARQHVLAYMAAPLFMLLIVVVLTLLVLVPGLLMRLDLGAAVVALFWPLALLLAFVMAFVLLGLWIGWPLLWGAISTEACDFFDAVPRAFSYVYQRPLRLVWYVVVVVVLGTVAWLFVGGFAEGVINLSYWSASWGTGEARMNDLRGAVTVAVEPGLEAPLQGAAGDQPADRGTSLGVATWLLRLWEACIRTIATAFAYSFFWVAASAIYLLRRYDVDQTEPDDIVFTDEFETPPGDQPLGAEEATAPYVPTGTSDGAQSEAAQPDQDVAPEEGDSGADEPRG